MDGANNKSVSLKDYINIRFNELEKYMKSKFDEIERAGILSQRNLDARLEGMNEFRESMKDQTASFMTRAEINLITERNRQNIQEIKELLAEARGKASQQSVIIAYLIAFVGIAIGIISLFIT